MIIALGDSLTFGYGVEFKNRWASICGYQNAGISGDTTGGMLSRLTRDVLSRKPEAVIVMGGINDFIMGASVADVKCNLMAISQQCLAAGISVTLASQTPCCYDDITDVWSHLADFREVYRKEKELNEWLKIFCPAFGFRYINVFDAFDGLGREYWQEDGLHPSAQGNRLLAELLHY